MSEPGNGKTFGPYSLHKLAYSEARKRLELPAQIAVRCIWKVADAYQLDKQTKRIFRPLISLAFDDRNLRWHVDQRTVSLGTFAGRIKTAFAAGDRQLRWLASRPGEADLVFDGGELVSDGNLRCRSA